VAGRVLHDRTADRIARAVSHVPDAAATIIPFDVCHHVMASTVGHHAVSSAVSPATDPIGALTEPRHATVQGRLQATKVQSAGQGTVLNWRITDATAEQAACSAVTAEDVLR
jgi:hypothetical protein